MFLGESYDVTCFFGLTQMVCSNSVFLGQKIATMRSLHSGLGRVVKEDAKVALGASVLLQPFFHSPIPASACLCPDTAHSAPP